MIQVQILGTGAGGPFQGRHYTAQMVQVDNQRFLVDCGEGTQQQLYKYRVRYDGVRQIFISHLHGDHVFGLAGLITSYCLKRRSARLDIFSPPGLAELIGHTFRLTGVQPPFPIAFHEVNTEQSEQVFQNNTVEVWTIPLLHRTPCSGWLFREKIKPRNMRKDKIVEYDIPYQQIPALKAGADLRLPDGRIIPNHDITIPPPLPLSYAFCSDTAFSERVIAAVQEVNLLYHEATFQSAHSEEAAFSHHTTAAQAAEVARRASAKKLLMGHFSSRYADLDQHLLEARAVFAESYVAEEGKTYCVA